jgi:hypothetical protein
MDFWVWGIRIGLLQTILYNRLRYPFETCIFAQVWFMANSGSEIAPNFASILWISQCCPYSGYSQYIATGVIFGFLAIMITKKVY